MASRKQDPLEQAFTRLEAMLPGPLRRALIFLHHPEARVVRIPLGILCIIAGLLWFLPVVGLEFLPIGLLLLAQDVPFLRRPVGTATLKLLHGASRLWNWCKSRWRRWPRMAGNGSPRRRRCAPRQRGSSGS